MKYLFNNHTYDFTMPCMKYDGVAIKNRKELASLYIEMLNNFGYEFSPMDSRRKLPPVMYHPLDVAYQYIRDCFRRTVHSLSIANVTQLELFRKQSLSPSGQFEDFVGLPIFVCRVYDSNHHEVNSLASSHIEDFVKFLDLQLGYYLVIS